MCPVCCSYKVGSQNVTKNLILDGFLLSFDLRRSKEHLKVSVKCTRCSIIKAAAQVHSERRKRLNVSTLSSSFNCWNGSGINWRSKTESKRIINWFRNVFALRFMLLLFCSCLLCLFRSFLKSSSSSMEERISDTISTFRLWLRSSLRHGTRETGRKKQTNKEKKAY